MRAVQGVQTRDMASIGLFGCTAKGRSHGVIDMSLPVYFRVSAHYTLAVHHRPSNRTAPTLSHT